VIGRTVAWTEPAEVGAPDDADLAAFAQSVELAMVGAYTKLSGFLSGRLLEMARTFIRHHQGHAALFGAAAGAKATNQPNLAIVTAHAPALSALGTTTGALKFAYTLENQAAATYQFALERSVTKGLIANIASVMPVEGQHATVLGTTLGMGPKETAPSSFQSEDGYLDPAKYPLAK